MKRKIILSFLAGLFFSLGIHAQNITVGGASFPSKIKISDKVVKFNGAGIRKKYFIKLYVSALYIPNATSDAQTIIDQNVESAVRLILLSDLVTREKFIETVTEGFATSTEGKATKAQIDKLMSFFKKEFKEGDDIILVYKPESGINVYKNGKHLGNVGGLEFKKALWGIWLGDKPVSQGLKNAMLGKV